MTHAYQIYLGDGVYAHHSQGSICLMTERDHGWERIYLDSDVLDAFLEWLEMLKKELAELEDEVNHAE